MQAVRKSNYKNILILSFFKSKKPKIHKFLNLNILKIF